MEESAELFIARAGVGGDLAETGYDAYVIAEVCRHLDGLPLGIELVSARSADVSTGSAAGAGPRALAVLRVDRRDLDARHRTLEATIGWSYDLLDRPPPAAVLPAVGVPGRIHGRCGNRGVCEQRGTRRR